jgi:hypothetical protein
VLSVSPLVPRILSEFAAARNGRRNKLGVILRSSAHLRAERLEGWPQAPTPLPSFETVARKRALPHQDDVCIWCMPANADDPALLPM